MNNKLKTVLLLVMFSIAAVGCDDEPQMDFQPAPGSSSVRYVAYTVDGVHYKTFIRNELALTTFIDEMLVLAKNGHSVSFRNASTKRDLSGKKEETFTTANEKEANKWCADKVVQGYEVFVEYDKRTGKYTCTAIK